MKRTIAEQKEQYIEEAVQKELGRLEEGDEDERLKRVQFWQKRSSGDRFRATSEIVKRVHLACGGSIADLKVNRLETRLVRKG